MSETDDDLRPLGADGRFSPVAATKMVAKMAPYMPGIVASIIGVLGAIHAYQKANEEAKAQDQQTKNKAEAGFQVAKHAIEELQAWRIAHEAEHAAEKAKAAAAVQARRPARFRRPPAPIVVTAPRPLPSNLDVAQRQIYPGTAPPAVPSIVVPSSDARP